MSTYLFAPVAVFNALWVGYDIGNGVTWMTGVSAVAVVALLAVNHLVILGNR